MDLQKFTQLQESKDSIVQKLKYLKNGGLSLFLDYALAEMGLNKMPKKNHDNIIQQIIAKSPNDLNKKVVSPEHYKAHLCCISHVLEEMFLHDAFIENLENYQVEEGNDIVVYNYYHLLHELLFDMALLIQDYKQTIKQIAPGNFSLMKNLYQKELTLYQLLPQMIFGQVSFHSFITREPFVSIALIRQMIELKIRKSFGILGTYDKSKDSFEPLPLGQIFDELKQHQSEIDFAVPLENIIRINGWANIYVHSGMKDYTWTIIFVYRYLHELMKGRKEGKSWSSNSGIRLTQPTLDRIVSGLENKLKDYNPDLELYRSKPDVCIII
jgi:hypothetical protein